MENDVSSALSMISLPPQQYVELLSLRLTFLITISPLAVGSRSSPAGIPQCDYGSILQQTPGRNKSRNATSPIN